MLWAIHRIVEESVLLRHMILEKLHLMMYLKIEMT